MWRIGRSWDQPNWRHIIRPTLHKRQRQTSNVSLVRTFSKLDLYWFYVDNGAWLGLARPIVLHSAYELELNYTVSACCFVHISQVHQPTLDDKCLRFYCIADWIPEYTYHLRMWCCIKSVPYNKSTSLLKLKTKNISISVLKLKLKVNQYVY